MQVPICLPRLDHQRDVADHYPGLAWHNLSVVCVTGQPPVIALSAKPGRPVAEHRGSADGGQTSASTPSFYAQRAEPNPHPGWAGRARVRAGGPSAPRERRRRRSAQGPAFGSSLATGRRVQRGAGEGAQLTAACSSGVVLPWVRASSSAPLSSAKATLASSLAAVSGRPASVSRA